MFAKIRSLFLAALLAPMLVAAVPVVSPAETDLSGSNFYFRYRAGGEMSQPGNQIEAKDIVAFFMGGVGLDFEEKLPIKPKWLGLTWKVVGDVALPKGITFDNATRTFSGKPTEVSRDHVVQMVGYTADGAEEATAQITFDIFEVRGEPFQITLYAHTGKYKYDVLPSPKLGVVDVWKYDANFVPPPGIKVNGPYYEGIPSTAGTYNIHLEGVDYKKDVIATYFVKYVVEDGPSFEPIPDDVRTLAPAGLPGWQWSGYFNFGAPSPYKVKYQIDPKKGVKYYLRIDTINGSMPGDVTANNDPKNLRIEGFVVQPYDTVTAHFHAVDSDGTTGDSNTFTFGTGDPSPACKYPGSYAPEKIVFVTGTEAKVQLAVPFGAQGTSRFTLTSGNLPEGLLLETGGRIVGTPLKAQPKSVIKVHYDVINGDEVVSAPDDCIYNIEVVNKKLKIFDSTAAQAQHGRVGAPYAGSMSVTGGIPDFTVDWVQGGHDTLSAAVPAENKATIPVVGKFEFAELPHKYGFNVVNGDENTATGTLNLFGHGPLAFGNPSTFVPNFEVTRLGDAVWGAVPYDDTTVVPDTSGAVDMPVLVLDKPGDLPSGIQFDGRSLLGVTQQPEGQYGPFRVTMSDFTGESIVSDDFYVTVKHRDEIAISQFVPPVFLVEQSSTQQSIAPVAKYPPGSSTFTRTWKLDGPALPSWAHFDATTGQITADAAIPYNDLKQPANQTLYGPYTVTVSDDDPLTPSTSAPTAPFYVTLSDMPAPGGKPILGIKGTVTGDAGNGMMSFAKSLVGIQSSQVKTVTTVSVRNISAQIDPTTIVGSVGDVLFLGSDPVAPAGLLLQVSDDGHEAWFEGSPTKPYTGTVQVNFKDVRGRKGSIGVQMEIRPYPSVRMPADSFDVPRLAPAQDYGISPVETQGVLIPKCPDCWTSPKWSIEATGGALPSDLTVNRNTGTVMGQTRDLDDETAGTKSPFEGIVLKATSTGANGEELVAWTQPFAIKVKPRVPMTLDYPQGRDTWFLNNKTPTTDYTFNARMISAPHVGGSNNPNVSFSADASAMKAGQGLDQTKGTLTWNLQTLGLGTWNPLVTATDMDGQQASANLEVKATLAGNVTVLQGGGNIKVRASEPFVTDDMPGRAHLPSIKVDNAVGDMRYSLTNGFPTVSILSTSGAFLDTSRIDSPGVFVLARNGFDADDRPLANPVQNGIQVVPPLAFVSGSPAASTARQYDPTRPVSIQFPKVDFVLGSLSFEVRGLTAAGLPGQIVYKVYDPTGTTFLHWQWIDADRREHLLDATDARGNSNADQLPDDALVFDPADMTLAGIPSKSGSFELALVASDDYMDGYLHLDDLHPLEKRIENNTATSTAAVTIDPALPLEIAMKSSEGDATSEIIHEYTQRPSLRGVVANAAYGKPLIWTLKAGRLPTGIAPFASGTDLAFGSYAEEQGTFRGIVVEGTDRAGRKILTTDSAQANPLAFTVVEREPFGLSVAENPRRMAVNLTDADMNVTPVNAAYGKAPPKADWSVSGQANLPPGVSVTVGNGSVNFSGVSSKIGEYGPVTVSAKDALGASASVAVRFSVRIPDGPIVLNVTDGRIKPGYPYAMVATSTNTYGTVTYNSYAINSTYKTDLKINGQSGRVEGSFKEPQKAQFDVWVTDSTNRVTSAPVTVEVIPFVRVTVPETVKATETKPMTQDVTTDYVLGTVRYKIGQGTWPKGLAVDPITGKISGTSNSEPGDYPGLTITATDTFVDYDGNMHTDVKDSNPFKIALDGIPDIADVNSTVANKAMLFTKDVQIAPFTPTVIDTITKKPFTLPGTLYSVNKDLEYETGLKLDPNTGTISGTPTALVVYTDFTMTVTSPNGNSDTTKPFYLAVKPQGTITATPGQKDRYVQRVGELFTVAKPSFDNTVGVMAYAQTTSKVTFDAAGAVKTRTASTLPAGLVFSSTTGVVSGTATAAGDYEIVVQATDGAGRQASFAYVLQVRGALALAVTKPETGLNIGQSYSAINKPTTTNVAGKAAFELTGLPNGMSFNTDDGTISGSPSAEYANGTVFKIHVKMTDSYDGQFRELDYDVTVALPILPAPGQKTVYNTRTGKVFATDAPIFINGVGALSFSTTVPGGVDYARGIGGLTTDQSTGVISGTPVWQTFYYSGYWNPATVGNASWSPNLTVTDSTGRTGKLPFTINVYSPLELSVASPVKGLDFDKSYSGLNAPTLKYAGGTVTWKAEGLPDGLTINPQTGALEGTIASGSYPVGQSFTVKVTATDSYDGDSVSTTYPLVVADPITVSVGQLEAYVARVGDVLRTNPPKFEGTYGAATLAQAGKPAWMTYNAADGSAAGTVTTATTGTTTITVTDSIGRTKTFAYSVVTKAALGLAISSPVNGVDIGSTYAAFNVPTAAGIGGTAAFEDVGGRIAATGLVMNTATGGITGSPDANVAPGTVFQAVVKVTDTFDDLRKLFVQSGNVTTPPGDATPFSRTVTYPLTVANKIVPTPGQQPTFATRIGDAFKTVVGFDNTIGTVTLTQAGKPAALSFDAQTGTLSGTLAAVADSTVTVTIKDSTGRSATSSFVLRSKGVLAMTLASPVNGLDIGKTYGATNTPAAANVGSVATFSDVGGIVGSTGMTFDPNKGGFSGSLKQGIAAGDTFNATIRLVDSYDDLRKLHVQSGEVIPPASDTTPFYREVTYVLTAGNPITVGAGQKTDYVGRVGDAFASEAPVFGETIGAVTYSATGVPAGLSVNPATGVVSGTIGSAAGSTITVTAKDGTGRTSSFAYRLVTKGVLTVTVPTLTSEIRQSAGKPYAAINRPTVTNVGGAVSFTATGLPAEFSIDANTGAITGTVVRSTYPDGTTFDVTVTATDTFDGKTKDVSYVLTAVNAPAPGIAVTYAATGYSATNTAAVTPVFADAKNGDVVTLAPDSAALPPGFSIMKNGSTWYLNKASGTNADIGVYRGVNLRVTDVDGLYGETGKQDVLLRSAAFLAYPNVSIGSRTQVPVDTGVPTASAGIPIADVSFAFSKDVTGGSLTIDPATGRITGSFTANGTNTVTVTESYDGKTIRTFTYNVTLTILPLSISMENVAGIAGETIDGKYAPVVVNTLPSGSFSLAGSVPTWLTIDPKTGSLSGTPDKASVGTVTMTYQDAWSSATTTFQVGASGGGRGFKYVKFEKGSTARTALNDIRFYDEYGVDAMKYASVFQQSPSGFNFSAFYDAAGIGTGADSTGDAYLTFVFPQRVNFAKATFSSNLYGSYCVHEPGASTWMCPNPGWDWQSAPARIYGSNDGVNFVEIGSVAQTAQVKGGKSAPVTIPLTQQ